MSYEIKKFNNDNGEPIGAGLIIDDINNITLQILNQVFTTGFLQEEINVDVPSIFNTPNQVISTHIEQPDQQWYCTEKIIRHITKTVKQQYNQKTQEQYKEQFFSHNMLLIKDYDIIDDEIVLFFGKTDLFDINYKKTINYIMKDEITQFLKEEEQQVPIENRFEILDL